MSATLERTAADIIYKAFRILRVTDAETPLESVETQDGLETLNDMVKHWQSSGFNLWLEKEIVLPLVKGKNKYSLGPNGDFCAYEDDFFLNTVLANALVGGDQITVDDPSNIDGAPNEFGIDISKTTVGWTGTAALSANPNLEIQATFTEDAVYNFQTDIGVTYEVIVNLTTLNSNSFTLSVEDSQGVLVDEINSINGLYRLRFEARESDCNLKIEATSDTITILSCPLYDIAKGDYIGLFDASNNIYWNNAYDVSGSVLTLGNALPVDILSGSDVYSFTKKIDRPMSIVQSRYKESFDFSDIPTDKWTRQEYFDQPDKTSQGQVTKWYYSPQLGDGDLRVWQSPSSDKSFLSCTVVNPIEITQTTANVPNFPSEWYLTLSYNLALFLSEEYAIPPERQQRVQIKAQELLDDSLGFDNEDTYLKIEVENYHY